MAYTKTTGTIQSTLDKLDLYYSAWIDENFSPDKSIVIHHGFGEHLGRYQNVIDIFKDTGYSIFIMDMRGHGQSGGIRGASPDFNAYIDDLHTFISFVREKFDIEKIILHGHSLGGLIVISYCLKNDYVRSVKSLAVNAPSLSIPVTPLMKIKRVLGNLLVFFVKTIRANVGLNVKYISHDKNVVKAYREDPLVHGMIMIQIANEILKQGKWCLENAARFEIPVLLTHGTHDRISSQTGTSRFYENCASVDKKLVLYEGLYHEVYNEIGKEKPLNDLKNWVLDHT